MKTDALDAATSEIAQAVKRIVHEFDPEAEVILYGSRARGDAEPDSDWDFLILTSRKLSFDEEERLHARLYPMQVERDAVCSILVDTETSWRHEQKLNPHFRENVEREGHRV